MSTEGRDVQRVGANPFAVAEKQDKASGMMEVAASRQAQEVQAAMVIAKKFPRNQFEAYNKIMAACKRVNLAEEAMYSYKRGTSMVTGPSIRLAEVLAQQWGNIDFGIIELEQRFQESTVMAYAWDLETNTRQTKIFTVPHRRHTKKGVYALTDPRDIYETVANNGARRLRACILGVIPGDIQDAAVKECEATLVNDDSKGPIEDRVRNMVVRFKEYGITTDMIEQRLGHNLDATSVQEVVELGKIYNSISKGMASAEQFFDKKEPEKSSVLKEKMEEQLKSKKSAKEDGKKPEKKQISESDIVKRDESYDFLNQAYDVEANWDIDGLLIAQCGSGLQGIKRDTTDLKEIIALFEVAKVIQERG